MSLVYVVGGLALVVCSGLLYVLEGSVGVPARVRRWLNPFASPLIALVGCLAYAVVASLLVFAVSRALSLPFELNSTAGDIILYGGSGFVALAAAFCTARWWQPIYLAGITMVLLTAGVQEDRTIGEALEGIVQVALLAGGLASVGVLLRFAHMARSQRLGQDSSGIGSLPRGTRTHPG